MYYVDIIFTYILHIAFKQNVYLFHFYLTSLIEKNIQMVLIQLCATAVAHLSAANLC